MKKVKKIKKPKLEFKEMFFVKEWGKEIIEGFGSRLEFFENSWNKRDCIIFFPYDGSTPFTIHPLNTYSTYDKALEALKKEKLKVKEYYEKQIREAQEKVKAL